MISNLENKIYKKMIFRVLEHFHHNVNDECVKKIESCLDTERLSDLHLEIACAIADKKKTDEIEHIINQFFK